MGVHKGTIAVVALVENSGLVEVLPLSDLSRAVLRGVTERVSVYDKGTSGKDEEDAVDVTACKEDESPIRYDRSTPVELDGLETFVVACRAVSDVKLKILVSTSELVRSLDVTKVVEIWSLEGTETGLLVESCVRLGIVGD